MLKVDEAVYDTNKVICRNISVFDASERGLLSQNILAQLRNFVEYIVQKVQTVLIPIPMIIRIKKPLGSL